MLALRCVQGLVVTCVVVCLFFRGLSFVVCCLWYVDSKIASDTELIAKWNEQWPFFAYLPVLFAAAARVADYGVIGGICKWYLLF